MPKRVLVFILLTLLLGACSSEDKSSTGAEIDYKVGFFAPERGPNGSTWRWMGPEGVIRLRNTRRDMLLSIKGYVPAQVPQPSAINVKFNGEPLDQMLMTKEEAQKQYAIPAAKQGSGEWSELVLSANQSYIPHEADPTIPDPRRLAFSLSSLEWTRK